MNQDKQADGKDLAKAGSEAAMPPLFVLHIQGRPLFLSDKGRAKELCEALDVSALQNPGTFIMQSGLMVVRGTVRYCGSRVVLSIDHYAKTDSRVMHADGEFEVAEIPTARFVKELCEPGNPMLNGYRVHNAA